MGKRRSGEAMAAQRRNSAGPMKHRNAPRGGSRREDYSDEYDDDDFLVEIENILRSK